MWKFLNRSSIRLYINSRTKQRTFLSEAYRCDDAWNERRRSPLLSKVNINELFVELDEKFQKTGKASAVDVDVYANVINDSNHSSELIDILIKHRSSTETTQTLDSTHHAVVRYFHDNDDIDDLLTILHDRYNYGIFPDHHCYNILMNDFTKKNDFASAAKVGVLLMLQEDSENPISNELALYSCHRYLEKPETWRIPEPEVDDDGEEIKIRVRYLRNPYFDDHFDLVQPNDLVGKTLVFYGKIMGDCLGRSCRLRGLILWRKFGEAVDLIREWKKEGTKDCVYEEAFEAVRDNIDGTEEDKATEEIKELKAELEWLASGGLKKGNMTEEMENRVKEAVAKQADADVAKQCQLYREWEKKRMEILELQLAEVEKNKRIENIEKMKKELFEKERRVTFFEKESEIELQIYEKLKMEREKFGKPVRTTKTMDDNYMPPEILPKR